MRNPRAASLYSDSLLLVFHIFLRTISIKGYVGKTAHIAHGVVIAFSPLLRCDHLFIWYISCWAAFERLLSLVYFPTLMIGLGWLLWFVYFRLLLCWIAGKIAAKVCERTRISCQKLSEQSVVHGDSETKEAFESEKVWVWQSSSEDITAKLLLELRLLPRVVLLSRASHSWSHLFLSSNLRQASVHTPPMRWVRKLSKRIEPYAIVSGDGGV